MHERGKDLGQSAGGSQSDVSHIGGFSVSLEKLPADAREKVDAVKVATWAREETRALTGAPRLVASESSTLMLQLLAFAYACNVLGSEQIMVACKTNPVFRSLCAGRPPFPPEISSFRRHHREELETVLAAILARVMQELTPATQVSLAALIESAQERMNIARHLDTAS